MQETQCKRITNTSIEKKAHFLAVRGSKIILKDKVLANHVVVFSETIYNILPEEEFHEWIEKRQDNIVINIIDHKGYVSPGFIDIHVHGAGGADVMDGSLTSLQNISKCLIQSGTTGFLATTMTMDQSQIVKSLDILKSAMQEETATSQEYGAEILGVHLEGPFISPDYKGAQDAKNIQKPTSKWIRPYLDIIKIITLAPEMDENFAFIKAMKKEGIVLSMGHTGCDFETACDAYDAGVEHVTHCFNAMTGLHHRNPGAVGATFAKPFTSELITDGIHVHKGFIEAFVNMKSKDKVIFITDAMRASFLEEGTYDLGGQKVIVKDGAPRLEDGTLAGSVHRMDKALLNVKENSSFTLSEIVNMLSLNPARRLGLEKRMGSIDKGKDANLILLSNDLRVDEVIIKGIRKYTGGKS
ncbi:N-acetylglucosamine-6-phosphate deacetylase [Fusibacter sp. JL216-2]|uniref:N-acetylglucosamine-6-phosphate deacetylase n=1 Tax=Fusibacter sp. JL216-2 TaxID=3071453 RepID=UPI003D33358C